MWRGETFRRAIFRMRMMKIARRAVTTLPEQLLASPVDFVPPHQGIDMRPIPRRRIIIGRQHRHRADRNANGRDNSVDGEIGQWRRPAPAVSLEQVEQPKQQERADHAQVELVCGPVALNTRTKRVTVNGNPIKLTSHEYNLLDYLMHHTGRVVSRTELVEHLYDQDFDRDSNTIEVFVGRLRKKLPETVIHTVRGLGYQILED